ncbi:MAG: flagellar assembly protein A [Sarcina sp.]
MINNTTFDAFEKIEILDSDKEVNYIKDRKMYLAKGFKKIHLKVSEGILLRINGSFKREGVISKSDLVEIGLNSVQPAKKFKFKIDDKFMNVYLECAYKVGEIFKIIEKEFTDEILIEKESVEVLQGDLLSANDIMKCLKEHSIIFGVQYKSFEDIINGKEAIIAIGKEVIPTVDDSLNVLFLEEEKKVQKDKVDHFNINKINSVKTGDILATIITGRKGQDGKDVRGTKIEAKEVKAIELNLASGCKKVGNNILATVDGMPMYSKCGNKFEVKKVYEVPLNVDLKSGNINFNGEVFINGNIEENLSVYGSCGVTVLKNVSGAKINSLGDVNVGGKLLQSTVRSGFLENEFKVKLISMKVVDQQFRALKKDIEVLINNNLLESTKIGSIVRALLDSKYIKIEKAYDFIKKDIEVLFGDVTELSDIYEKKILRLACLNIKSLGEVDDILNVIEKYLYEIDVIFNLESKVNIGYCQASSVVSKGNIYINSEGVYVSDFVSDDSIIFLNEQSVLRGGKLRAKKSIKAGIIGTMSGVITELEVEDGGIIECKKAYYNTKFKIGNRIITLEENYKDLKVFKQGDNSIAFEGLKM